MTGRIQALVRTLGGEMDQEELLVMLCQAAEMELAGRLRPGLTPEDIGKIYRQIFSADCYFASANAVTEDGLMVQIDGTGNRVGATCYGPGTVYVLIGRNKIVSGGYAQAVKRIKEIACPQNARRQHLPMCRNGALQSRPMRRIHVPRHGGV